MTKKSLLPLAILSFGAVNAQNTTQPNVLLINIDDLGWGDLSFIDDSYYETPNIDKLYSQSTYFPNGYAAAANSAPSRSCMMTGLYSPRHGVYTVNPAARGKKEDRKLIPFENKDSVDGSFVLIPEMFKSEGYSTCSVGKWHLGNFPESQGVDVNVAGYKVGHPKSYFSPYKNPKLSDGEKGEYLTDRLTVEAINFLRDRDKNKPFFLYYASYAVHTPLQAPKELVDKYKAKKATDKHFNPVYAAMVENMDKNVGKLLEELEKQGVSDNTFVIFTSDNGGVYDISRQWPLRAGKGSFYEGGIRVPIMIRDLGGQNTHKILDERVSQIDFMPTLRELIGAKNAQKEDGESILGYLRGKSGAKIANRKLYWHFPAYLEGGNIETKDVIFRSRPVSVMIDNNMKIIRNIEDNSLELYDLSTDVSEKNDISAQNPKLTHKLARELDKWLEKVDAGKCKPINDNNE